MALSGRSLLIGTSWVPLLVHLLVLRTVGRYEGWGAWAAAPLFIPGIVLSAGMALAGAALFLRRQQRANIDVVLLAATALAGSVAGYYLVRVFVVTLAT